MVAKAMRGLARPGVEDGADRGENWLRKARSVISGVFSGAILRLTCYSSARGRKSSSVDACGCIEAVAEDEKEDGSERTRPDLGELIYGSGRGGAGRLEGSVRSLPLSSTDVMDSECGENGERRGEKAGPYGQMALSKRHQRAMLRLSAVFKKNPSVKLLNIKVGKSNGNSIDNGAEKRCTGTIRRSTTVTARAVAWVWMKLQGAQQKMKVKTVGYKVSNPIKEEERLEEDGEEDDDHVLTDEEEEGAKVELCKKRILMGRRCKPLNCSGTLQYDNYGILIPELFP